MSTTEVVEKSVAREKSEDQIAKGVGLSAARGRRPGRKFGIGAMVLLGTLAGWALLRFAFAGRWTLPLGERTSGPLHTSMNSWPDWVTRNQDSNPLFLYFINHIRVLATSTGDIFNQIFFQTDTGAGIPEIGWLGTTVLVTFVAYAVGNVKVAVLALVSFLFFVLQGLWNDSMATFALVLASVFFSFLIGIPLGIWAGVSDRVNKIITPVLDFMQIMPSLAYLTPLVLIFAIGPASAIAATVIFAMPPVIRITAHGIRQVPATTREAVQSLGVTGSQRLRTVLLPMAKRTIVIGVNQTFMAALAMVVIASFVGAPGLGSDVARALQTLDVGGAFNAGLAIVLMAIVFDRVTTAASVRAELAVRAGRTARRKRLVLVSIGAVITLVAIYLSRTYVFAAVAPDTWPDAGHAISVGVGDASDWVQNNLSFLTSGLKNGVAYGLLNPLESFITGTPWFVMAAVVTIISFVAGGWRVALVGAIGSLIIFALGLWADSMVTLASTLVATIFAMILSLVVGVWMGRSKLADNVIRPILDAAQTMPAFVYLVPFLGLFNVGRVTAIFAAIVYAAPPAIKIIADGISQVPANTVEAARSTGSTSWQMISKVQVPMCVKAIALAANQCVIYTLSMIVIGAAIGAGALGYDVINGLSNSTEFFGKGFAAGLALVALGIILDRITQAASQRSGRPAAAH